MIAGDGMIDGTLAITDIGNGRKENIETIAADNPPTAKVKAPWRTAATEVTNSGKEVAKAVNKPPTTAIIAVDIKNTAMISQKGHAFTPSTSIVSLFSPESLPVIPDARRLLLFNTCRLDRLPLSPSPPPRWSTENAILRHRILFLRNRTSFFSDLSSKAYFDSVF